MIEWPVLRNREGRAVYRMVDHLDEDERVPVLVILSPPTYGWGQDSALCGAIEYGPFVMGAQRRRFLCERPAFHQGDHAYVLGEIAVTFSTCRCQKSRFNPEGCLHFPTAIAGCSPGLMIFVEAFS